MTIPARAVSAFALALAVASCTTPIATPERSPSSTASDASGASRSGSACEYFGTRFVPPVGWTVEEARAAGEPLSRVTLSGRSAAHQLLISIIPRKVGHESVDPTPAEQASAYFGALRRAPFAKNWADITETRFESPERAYPVLIYRERIAGALPMLDTQQENVVLLFFPDDFPYGQYFYVFFWTDIHAPMDQPLSLATLRSLVDSFSIKSPPVGAPSRGCGIG